MRIDADYTHSVGFIRVFFGLFLTVFRHMIEIPVQITTGRRCRMSLLVAFHALAVLRRAHRASYGVARSPGRAGDALGHSSALPIVIWPAGAQIGVAHLRVIGGQRQFKPRAAGIGPQGVGQIGPVQVTRTGCVTIEVVFVRAVVGAQDFGVWQCTHARL